MTLHLTKAFHSRYYQSHRASHIEKLFVTKCHSIFWFIVSNVNLKYPKVNGSQKDIFANIPHLKCIIYALKFIQNLDNIISTWTISSANNARPFT